MQREMQKGQMMKEDHGEDSRAVAAAPHCHVREGGSNANDDVLF